MSKKRKSFKQDSRIQNESGKMEKSNKPLSRDELVSMQVIDAKGRLVGKVKDVVFQVGKAGISLSVLNEKGETQNVGWEDVQGASDFIVLKPVAQSTYEAEPKQAVPKQKSTQPLCPTCNQPLTWIPQYKRWYCYNDKKYVNPPQSTKKEDWEEVFQEQQTTPKKQSTKTLCPTCNRPLTWIPQYKRWYCYNEKKYV
jgi:sporulation protein YlmC with PRC-barrel domain